MRQYARVFGLVLLLLSIPTASFASTSNGTIDPVDKYAWSENSGWINFASSGNVHVTDTQLIGYAWNETTGWINLQPPTSGVTNDAEGNLGGYAWGEGIGWIDFSAVTIDSQGYFHGYADSDTGGQISFNCLNSNTCASGNFKVRTDWRPMSTPGSSGGGSGSSHRSSLGGGRVDPIAPVILVTPPAPGIPTTPAISCTLSLTTPIQFGKKNDATQVMKLQQFLQSNQGETAIVATGTYDKATFDAVIRLQEKYAADVLTPWKQTKGTGYVYTTTLKKINELYCHGAVQPITSKLISTATTVLKFGASGVMVTQLQHFLATQGYFTIPANGNFGPATKAAVMAFQQKHKLIVDGIVGPQMRKEMEISI